MRNRWRVLLLWPILACLGVVPAAAQGLSPEGRWRTIDDKSGLAKSIVNLKIVNGELQGIIERVFVPPAKEERPVCTPCPGEFDKQQIIGMRFLWGLKNMGEWFDGGRVFDPDVAKTYRAKVRVVEGGKKLEIRGYIGFSLLGRTQTWLRES